MLKQAFNIRIQDSGIEDGDMNLMTLPKETFGLPIPQVLSDTEKACMKNAHVHVDAVFCKWNLSIYVFEYPIQKTVERRLKLAREQAYDMGISHRWKFIRHVRLIDINFSGVPRMAKFGHWNWACRRTRRSPSADDTAHDFLVLPQSHCPQECGKVGECTNAFNDVNTFMLRYRLKKSILRLDPNTFGLHENENNVLSHATKAVKTIRRRLQASYTAQTTLRRILITRVRMLR